MIGKCGIAALSLSAFLFTSTSRAQKYEVGVFGGYSRISDAALGSINVDDPQDEDTRLKGQYATGIRLTRNTRGYYGHELGLFQNMAVFQTKIRQEGGTRRLAETRVKVHGAAYNFLIYFMPAGERWRPFITGGAQAHQYGVPRLAEYTGNWTRNYGANWGGGLKLKLFSGVLMRIDVREYIGGKPYDLNFRDATRAGGLIRQREATVGLSAAF